MYHRYHENSCRKDQGQLTVPSIKPREDVSPICRRCIHRSHSFPEPDCFEECIDRDPMSVNERYTKTSLAREGGEIPRDRMPNRIWVDKMPSGAEVFHFGARVIPATCPYLHEPEIIPDFRSIHFSTAVALFTSTGGSRYVSSSALPDRFQTKPEQKKG